MSLFNPSRMTVARKRNGLTMTALAAAIGKSPRVVSDYESGTQPPVETIADIAEALGYPEAFFFEPDLSIPDSNAVSFRALSKMSAIERDRALSQGALAIDLNRWIEQKFDLPPVDLVDLSQETDPEAAAMSMRRLWGLGEWPVSNMIHLLEAKGIRVYSLSVDSLNVDAYSMWQDNVPFICLNTQKSPERSRFDAAHELGHLLLHRHALKQDIKAAEEEANQFASAFLMPRSGTIAKAPRFVTIEGLLERKQHWGVSAAALNHRYHQLLLTNDWQYRQLSSELSKRGYRTNEPKAIPRESSMLLDKVLTSLRGDSLSQTDIAHELKVPVSEIRNLIFGLTVTAIEGGKKKTPAAPNSPQRLRLVEKSTS